MSNVQARRACAMAYWSAPATSFALAMAALGHPKIAIAVAFVAAALFICPLVWALKQEARR